MILKLWNGNGTSKLAEVDLSPRSEFCEEITNDFVIP
jgi:hypothetical protein